jgi:uncharacterized protein involved in response to NO
MATTPGIPGSSDGLPEPYRILFPLGVLYALLAAVVWPLHVWGGAAYPASLHAGLMIQGFQQCFVLGFFLTAMPAFTRGARCHPAELATALGLMLAFGTLAVTRHPRWAELAYAGTLALIVFAGGRRVRASRSLPPEEFLFVGVGLLLGLAGAVVLAGAGTFLDPARFGIRLVSLGMVLSLVLGFGGLLVPTFARMRAPLEVPGIAGAHERGPRRRLYVPIAILLIGAFVAEAAGRGPLGAWIRVVAAAALVLLVWKVYRLPGRRDLVSFAIWSAGWLVLAGLLTAAIAPRFAVAGHHVVMLGGFGFLTLGIATRVVASHGGHGLERESRVLTPAVVAPMALALATRALAEAPLARDPLLAASAVLWMIAWIAWAVGAVPAIATRARPAPRPTIPIQDLRTPGPAPAAIRSPSPPPRGA